MTHGLEAAFELGGAYIAIASAEGRKSGELLFQLDMNVECPIQESGPGASGAIFFDCLDRGVLDPGIGGESQVIVRSQHDGPVAVHHDLGVLP